MGTIRNCGHCMCQQLVVGVAHVQLMGVATDAHVSTISMENIVNSSTNNDCTCQHFSSKI